MPMVESTATFKKTGDNEFCGFLSEALLILPESFENAIEVKGQKLLTAWGSVQGRIKEGELLNREPPPMGKYIRFIKTADQLSGCSVECMAIFSEAAGSISGRWSIIEGGTHCYLPLNLKRGHFILRKPDDGRRVSIKADAPVTPELLPA